MARRRKLDPSDAKWENDPVWRERRKMMRERRDLFWGFGRSAVAGTQTIEVMHPHWRGPVAVVWFQYVGATGIEIVNSLTHGRLRRCGLRTFLQEKLFEHWPACTQIITQEGTPEGEAWMRASGYRRTKLGWICPRPKTRKAKTP